MSQNQIERCETPRSEGRDMPRSEGGTMLRLESRDVPMFEGRDEPRFEGRDEPMFEGMNVPMFEGQELLRLESREVPRLEGRDMTRSEISRAISKCDRRTENSPILQTIASINQRKRKASMDGRRVRRQRSSRRQTRDTSDSEISDIDDNRRKRARREQSRRDWRDERSKRRRCYRRSTSSDDSRGSSKNNRGLDAELYYVREGVVNTYATSFIVPVPAHIADLEFMWQALGRKPLPYSMAIDYESRGAMLPPQVNISERGFVPTTLQAFRVRLPCTGSRSAEILVTMQLNISSPDRAHKDVRLLFKRNKICWKGLSSVVTHNDTARLAGDATRGSSGVLLVAGGCAAAALALLGAAAAAGTLYKRGSKARHHDSIHTSYTTTAYGSHQNVLLRLDTLGRPPSSTGSYATIASLHKFPFGSRRSPSPYATTHIGEHIYAKPESRVSYYAASNLTHVSQQTLTKDRITDPAEQLQHLTTARSNIRLEILVHEGTFGRVYKGVFKKGDTYEEVIVKTVSDAASAMQAALLVAEGLRLCGLAHANVLAPMAACAEEARRPLLVYCCASHSSNLKRFLTSCRLGHQASPATRELVDLGAQAACGLAYLHVQRLVHADVAARNCIVDEKLRLKVTDNGLSRDLFPDDYHCLGDNENRPVKWMAPETLLQNQYTTASDVVTDNGLSRDLFPDDYHCLGDNENRPVKWMAPETLLQNQYITASDVWSLGVTLWELATLGASPLAELDAADVGAFLSGGYRPSQPHNCPDELYGLMSWCWTTPPSTRPTAPQLLAALHDFRQALSTYI